MSALLVFSGQRVPFLNFIFSVGIHQAAGESIPLFPNDSAVPGVVAEQIVLVVFLLCRAEDVQRYNFISQIDQSAAFVFGQDVSIVFAVCESDCGAIVGQPNIIGMLPSILDLKIGCLA